MASRRFPLPALIVAMILAGVLIGASVSTMLTDRDKTRGSDRTVAEAENAIFVMGDGMGQAHRDAVQLATVGPYDRLTMDKLPYAGMVGTDSAGSETFVTDSAAAATSFATGVKTYNGAIGMDEDGEEVATIIERAKAAGKSVGLVTTSQVTDASPAAFASHVEDRGQQSEIARQYIEEIKVDVVLGGGENLWYPADEEGAFPGGPSGNEEDEPQGPENNLVERAQDLGYDYVTDQDELEAADGEKVLGLFANEKMFRQRPDGEGGVYDPSVPLPMMTQKAIELLSRDPQGYFLFVEEDATDAMSHNNNGPLTIEAGRALDDAVKVAERLADEGTLLVVTADHECGGLTIEGPDLPAFPDESDGPFDVADSDYRFVIDWTTTGHTAVDVPLTAKGPGAEQLTGNHENTEVHDVIAETLGVT